MLITNENKESNLKQRLTELIEISDEMKFLVGFFYFSGIQELYEALKEKDDPKLKVLVGMNIDNHLGTLVEHGESLAKPDTKEHARDDEKRKDYFESLRKSFNSDKFDNPDFYEQVKFFLQLIAEEKLIIRKTNKPNHSKLYLFELEERQAKDRMFITGSSNLTKPGIVDQDEFNIETSDYGGMDAKEYFDDLWGDAVKITEIEEAKQELLHTIENETLVADVSPFEAYALVLKSYLDTVEHEELPMSTEKLIEKSEYKHYQYQIDAVEQALSIIGDHNGVIISDVVGLGKSIIAGLVANSLNKRGLIISPPGLIGDDKKQSGWKKYMEDFHLYDWEIQSSGKLEEALEMVRANEGEFEAVIVDEAHRFRNEDTQKYEMLSNICRDKKVMLLTATPFNNKPSDIFSLLKLFVTPGKSDITLTDNLERKFNRYNHEFRKLTYVTKYFDSDNASRRERATKKYQQVFDSDEKVDIQRARRRIDSISDSIKSILESVMIRRNRIDLEKDPDYQDEVDQLVRPEDPKEVCYKLNEAQGSFYDTVLKDYFAEHGGEFTGAMYRPFEYESGQGPEDIDEGDLDEEENRQFVTQRNLFNFIRRSIVKRFESSFGAFQESMRNYERTTEAVLDYIDNSGGKFILDRDLMESMHTADEDEIEESLEQYRQKLEEQEDPPETDRVYDVNSFVKKEEFIENIESDLNLYKQILSEIQELDLFGKYDPKIRALVEALKEDIPKLNEANDPKRKVIVFSEFTDTIDYLEEELNKHFPDRVLSAAGNLSQSKTETILRNFDASHKKQEDDFDILLATDKLAEGFNLNRAGAVINFDIPWNPTRVIQRVGRINRIGEQVFNKLYIFNFFPSEKGQAVVNQRQAAEDKMMLIHNTLGEDAKIFDPDEEPSKSELYDRLQENPNEDEEMSLVTKIKREFEEIEANHPDVAKRAEELPNRIKVSKSADEYNLTTFIRKGRGFFIRNIDGEENITSDLSLPDVRPLILANPDEESLPLDDHFWDNYQKVKDLSVSDTDEQNSSGGSVKLEGKARNNLKSIQRLYRNEMIDLSDDLHEFINDLLDDLVEYKTLPTPTYRRIKNIDADTPDEDDIKETLTQIREEVGASFLHRARNEAGRMEDTVIIAIENKQS